MTPFPPAPPLAGFIHWILSRNKDRKQICAGSAARSLPTLSPAAIMSRVKGWIIALCGLLAKSSGIRAEQRGEEKRKLTCNVKCHSPGVNQRKTRPQSLKRSSTGDFQAESRPQGSTHGFREQFVFQKGRRKNHKQICAGSAARSLHARAAAAIMSSVKVPLYPWPPSAPRCHGCDYVQGQRLETVQDVQRISA